MIGGVAGRRDRFQREAIPIDAFAVRERAVGDVGEIVRSVETLRCARARHMGARADDRRARPRLQDRGAGGMVAVGMGDDDVANPLALDGREEGVDMGFVRRARIDDRDFAGADDVAARAGEGVGRGVAGDEAARQVRLARHDPAPRLLGAGRRRQIVRGIAHDALRFAWRRVSLFAADALSIR